MKTTVYVYARTGYDRSDLHHWLREWGARIGARFTVLSAVSGPGYVVRVDGELPYPENVYNGSEYWYPAGMTVERVECLSGEPL